MPDPISLAAGYFIFNTAISIGQAIKGGASPEGIGDELMKAAAGNFYSDLLKAGLGFGGRAAWKNIAGRLRSEYNSDKPLNHDLQKAIRKAQLGATISACEACFEELKDPGTSLLETIVKKMSPRPGEVWLRKVMKQLTLNLADTAKEEFIPTTLTDDAEVLSLADATKGDWSETAASVSLVNSIREQTILELRFAVAPDPLQSPAAKALEKKIHGGWTKTIASEEVHVDWYRLMCELFNEEYKNNARVTNALQKAYFQDIRSNLQLRDNFTGFSTEYLDKFSGQVLKRFEIIEKKQDSIYQFIQLFRDDNDRQWTDALDSLKETREHVTTVVNNLEIKILNRLEDTKTEIIDEIKTLLQERDRQHDRQFSARAATPSNDAQLDEIKQLLLDQMNERKAPGKGKSALETFTSTLKARYKKRYDSKLDRHFELTLRVNESWEFSEKFDENPGDGAAIDVVTNLFAEKGRLSVIGNPGVGKTVLLLKLAIDLLERSDVKRGDAFPVILNLASWSEEFHKFEDWLMAMITRSEGLSPKIVAELLAEERIILLLDGFDELGGSEEPAEAQRLRTKCMNALANYLDYGKRVVICSRINEFVEVSGESGGVVPVSAVVRILDLTDDQILFALNDAMKSEPDRIAAGKLLKILNTDLRVPLLQVLRTSFYFSTALTVFDRHTVEDTLPADSERLKKYLLDKFVLRKLDITKNRGKFEFNNTFRWLKWLAATMNEKNKVAFELADLQPSDLRRPWIYKILYGLLIYVSMITSFTLTLSLFGYFVAPRNADFDNSYNQIISTPPDQIHILIFVFVFYLVIIGAVLSLLVLPFCLLFGFRSAKIVTEDSSEFSLKPLLEWQSWKNILLSSTLYGAIAFIIGLIFSIAPINSYAAKFKLITGLTLLVTAFALIERTTNYFRIIKKFETITHDYQRLRTGIFYNILRWNIFIVACYMLVVNISIFSSGPFNPYSAFAFLPFTLPLSVLNAALLKHILLRFLLVLAPVIPVRFATFLNYATDARILEKDGGTWRFRHRELQDYFMSSGSAPVPAYSGGRPPPQAGSNVL